MIRNGVSSREAILRLFGIHHGHLKGTSILFASYETDGFTSGEAFVYLRDVKTCDLLLVHGVHANVNILNNKKGLKGLFKGQWKPEVVSPKVALKMTSCKYNPRLARIILRLLRQQELVAKFNTNKNKSFSLKNFVLALAKRIKLFPSRGR